MSVVGNGGLQGGGGGGFALGAVNNTFGNTGSSGGEDLSAITIAPNRSTAEATRDAYDTANPGWIDNYTDRNVNIRLYYLDGGNREVQHQKRIGSIWENNNPPVIGVQGEPGSETDFSMAEENELIAIGAGPTYTPFGTGTFVNPTTGLITAPLLRSSQVEFEGAIASGSGIEDICYFNQHRNFQQHAPLRRAELSASDRVLNKVWSGATQSLQVRQAVDTETLVDPTFDLTVDASSNDGIRIAALQVNFASPATNVMVTITRSSRTVYSFNAGDFAAGLQVFDLMTDPGQPGQPGFVDVLDGDVYTFTVTNASLLGNPSNVPYYALTFRAWNYSQMAHLDDIPTQIVARTDQEIINVIATAMDPPGTGISIDNTTDPAKIKISATSPTFDTPRITNFSIDIPSRVDLNTDLNNSRTLTFDVIHQANIDGSLTLVVTTGDDKTISGPFLDGANSLPQVLSGINTASAGDLTFQLTGTDTNGGSIQSNIVTISVRDLNPHEYIYYGLSGSNNPASVDTGTLTQLEARSGDNIVSTGSTTSGQYFIILIPSSFTVNSITDDVLQQDVLSIFAHTATVRQINSENYDSYVLGPLNAGGSEQYTINLT